MKPVKEVAKPPIGDAAVRTKTGRNWREWVELLDAAGAAKMTHKQIAAWLQDQKLIESGWWAQSVTVGYEYIKGRRAKGETDRAGFEIGVQKTLPIKQSELWNLLTKEPRGLKIWLGTDELKLDKGATFTAPDGTRGEIRSIKQPQRLRLTWQPKDRIHPTTLQLYLECPRNSTAKTRLLLHHEKLSDSVERATMRRHWQDVLGELEALL